MLDRGPDSHQVIEPTVFLKMGASRLAMTDPHPRSNQPYTKNGDWIVFNGEIYNYKELRSQIADRHGVKFDTYSDTEVLLEVLGLFGSAGIHLLNGMYAFAYFNAEQRKLLVARDSLGKKPLYFVFKDDCFIWASTLKALQEIVNDKSYDIEGVIEYLTLGYTLDPKTVFSKISAVRPGFCYEVSLNGDVTNQPIFGDNYSPFEVGVSLEVSLSNAVQNRIDGHERVAVSLSGGLDSSIIAYLASKTTQEVVAYSIYWSDSDKDRYNRDYECAKIIANRLGIEFVGVDFGLTKDKLENYIVDFVRVMGEPNANPSGISMIPLYRRISEDGIRLALTGDGSDEVFGGYPRYRSKLLGTGFRLLSDRATNLLVESIPMAEKALLRFAKCTYPGLWANYQWNFKPREVESILHPKIDMTRKRITRGLFSAITDSTPDGFQEDQDPIEVIMRRDSLIWLNNESNRKIDRISMAFSVEARSPFQDIKVIQQGRDLMADSKFRNLDKEILRSLYPEVLAAGVRRDKAGFISPVGHWLRSYPEIIEIAFESLHDVGIFKHEELNGRKRDQFSGNFHKIRQLWSLVILGYWFRMSSAP